MVFFFVQALRRSPDEFDSRSQASTNGYSRLQNRLVMWRYGLKVNWPELKNMLDRARVDRFYVASKDDEKRLTVRQRKFDVSQSTQDGYGFIHTLVASSADDEGEGVCLLKKVLALGADPERETFEGDRPSHLVGECGLVEMATVLGMCRVDMSAENRSGKTPMEVAKAVSDEEGWVRNERDEQPAFF
jgi:hypothetical protein